MKILVKQIYSVNRVSCSEQLQIINARVYVYAATYIGYQLCPANAMTNTIGVYLAYFHRLVYTPTKLYAILYTVYSDVSMDAF